MNLFQKYGIKEVADVVFYSINKIGNEEIYTPVLYLDSLKVSTLEKSAEKVSAQGGRGNKKLINWKFGKEITLTLEDALFSPASMSMIWGGDLTSNLSIYVSLVTKLKMVDKYTKEKMSVKAYPSPALTSEELNIITEIIRNNPTILPNFSEEIEIDAFNYNYYTRAETLYPTDYELIINEVLNRIQKIKDLEKIKTVYQDIEVIDRMEKCIVKNKNGFKISTQSQKNNLLKLYSNDNSETYTIYYDAKTMLPLLSITDDNINGWDNNSHVFTLKMGTIYYKWTRTVMKKQEDVTLGKILTIDSESFPDTYKIVGETYIREQKTGKDQRYQFTIFRADISSDTSITLEAEGEPTVFSMQIDVLTPENDIMMELKQYDVEEDLVQGGTMIIPMKNKLSHTATGVEYIQNIDNNEEIY